MLYLKMCVYAFTQKWIYNILEEYRRDTNSLYLWGDKENLFMYLSWLLKMFADWKYS